MRSNIWQCEWATSKSEKVRRLNSMRILIDVVCILNIVLRRLHWLIWWPRRQLIDLIIAATLVPLLVCATSEWRDSVACVSRWIHCVSTYILSILSSSSWDHLLWTAVHSTHHFPAIAICAANLQGISIWILLWWINIDHRCTLTSITIELILSLIGGISTTK